MKFIKPVFNFYLNSSIHVALAAYALTWITIMEFDISYDEHLLYFVFFATITGYNFVKFFGIAQFHHRSLTDRLKVIQIFSFFAFVALCYYGAQLQLKTLLVISVLGLITFLYAVPLIPKKIFIDPKKNLRAVGGLKIYLIAFVWTFTTVILPLVNNDVFITTDAIITCIQRFLYTMVLMLPFEIRDFNYDSIKLATIPQKIGIKKTKIIGVLLLMVFFFLDYFKDNLSGKSIMVMLIVTFITLLFLVFSSKTQSRYYSAFWVESLPVIWLTILLMLR
ncbi:hypothetical protein [uncultured Winogradskyella sp.]|uniref:hypothetical protein n=1 Tax=uncultured Winogradskyella sp. TaxID=395353 RepID=UPI0026289D2D|nr:hypothetical protein [uncultured Winogradskyella sp.]